MNNVELTGNCYTARELGEKLNCSARKVNKRLVNAGFARRWPTGDLDLTVAGKIFGEMTLKKLKYGYIFRNIKWDEAVLPYICDEADNADELA